MTNDELNKMIKEAAVKYIKDGEWKSSCTTHFTNGANFAIPLALEMVVGILRSWGPLSAIGAGDKYEYCSALADKLEERFKEMGLVKK
jgi:hypothetical protein